MALQFISKVCGECGITFRTSNDLSKCYNCTLVNITRGVAPEEGDFNSAGIISGTLPKQERRYLQSDLESVELGMTTQEEYEEDEEEDCPDDWAYDEMGAARWGDEG